MDLKDYVSMGILPNFSKPELIKADWSTVTEFENKIAEFFGAPYAVAVDSCTHGIELCLRYIECDNMYCAKNTYISVPMLARKLGIKLIWWDLTKWVTQYPIRSGIIDAATLWRKDSYNPGHIMCISFQYQKHLSLGRGGMILLNKKDIAIELKKMSYDGREPGIPWREQNIKSMGYHYYMTPETAAVGLLKLPQAIATPPRIWTSADYPDLTQMDVFKNTL